MAFPLTFNQRIQIKSQKNRLQNVCFGLPMQKRICFGAVMKIAVARFWYEANSFSPFTVGMAEFRAREWLRGDAVGSAFRGTATEIGGALEWADARPEVELVFSRCASAPPGGPVKQELLDEIVAEIAGDPLFHDVDGIYLSLHGASLGTESLASEEEIVCRLRACYPETPIVASFDMHACPTQRMVAALNGAAVYRTYPHIDMAETAVIALELLAQNITGEIRSSVLMQRINKILPSFGMRTAPGAPMTEVVHIANEQVSAFDGVFAVCPFASFAYADTPAANAGVLVTYAERSAAERAAAAVCRKMVSLRKKFTPKLRAASEVLQSRPWDGGKRIAILEPSDNPLSGGGGDTPGLFKAALDMGVPEGSVFAFFNDSALVARAAESGLNSQLDVALGGQLDRRFGAPVAISVYVEKLTMGRFVNAGPMEAGRPTELGPTVLLRSGPLRIIVTSAAQSPNDINYFTLHGINLEHVPVLLAKAKNHFMAALGPIFDRVIQVDTLGPAMANTYALPFQHVPVERFDLS
ncbi:M81 family metallopeptidase [Sulfitobacter sp. S0837]|uniref:M81 family metallopeptidase n=1 Tax=Sulfitobacter maritimus TaxID=2741719 RepID=UPI0015834C8E|nr:M81 family metallopeptidase [Sulfitobacter maritimus]NUH65173.1 M81 family metallopeptidase [Sulfitobacter maritimus]